jgi:hypothetical protein
MTGRDRMVYETGGDRQKLVELAEASRMAFGDCDRANVEWLSERYRVLKSMTDKQARGFPHEN